MVLNTKTYTERMFCCIFKKVGSLPKKVAWFLKSEFASGSTLPGMYLSEYEKQRVQMAQKALWNCKSQERTMSQRFFIFSKTLVAKNIMGVIV